MAYSWVRFNLQLYTRSDHNFLVEVPFYAVKMTNSEYQSFYSTFSSYNDKTLIRANGGITTILEQMVSNEFVRTPSSYVKIDEGPDGDAMDRLDTAVRNARIVLPNSRDISEILLSLGPYNTTLLLSYSLDGGNTIVDGGSGILVDTTGTTHAINIYGHIGFWLGTADFTNVTVPEVALYVPILTDGVSYGYTPVIMGGPGYGAGDDLARYRFYYNEGFGILANYSSYAEDVTPEVPTDPYSKGGESDIGGGTGTFDGTSVDVDFTTLPTLSAVDTGFITLYNPTLTQLKALASYMWSGAFDLDTLKKLFGDPMQAILGLSIVPGPIPSSGFQTVKVGNISTGISMTKADSQYIDVDCGTLNVEEFWGAYLDYEPYTKAEIYLPYIGTHQIAVDDIMGKAVHIKYHIDILSGACAAEIKCGGSVLYTFIGSVAVSIPVTGNDWTNVINGVLSIAGAVGSLVATGGAAAPAAAGEIASAAVNSLKPNIEKSGAVSGGGGLMAGKVPVLILTRPRQALPASQNEYTGYPAFITRSLGAVSGYTEVHKIRLGGISATDAELDEIENLLKGGVIL